MIQQSLRRPFGAAMPLAIGLTVLLGIGDVSARQGAKPAVSAAQKVDAAYTRKILENTPDKRILTELVDHMPVPVDPKVPSPLQFLGYVPGENNMLTYHKDIVRYIDALQKASPRVKMWNIGKSEEGRDMVAVAIADEATIKNLQHFKDITAQLTDPRTISEAVAKQLIATGKPIYYANGSIHTPETGSPEMLTELAYRLAIEETPFIQEIRNNVIFVMTPVSEVDGREKQVDNQRAQQAGQPPPGLAYWGHYVQHDNNRDGIGKGLALTNNILKSFLDLHPTVFHDLHESVDLLYVSTGTGPYNPNIAPIQVTEWWWLAQNEIMEMTKRGVPGVWTYDYYDGWVPNYLFWIGVMHNSIGRFYETQSYGGGRGVVAPGAAAGRGAANPSGADTPPVDVAAQQAAGGRGQSGNPCGPGNYPPANEREWYRVNPNPGCVGWSGRANINMQESALLITLNTVAKNREKFLENYYIKNKQMVEKGKTEAPYAYVIPAKQRRQLEAAEMMNLIKREGAEVHTANTAFSIGNVQVAAGDYIVRLDQPYRGIVETLLGVQWYPGENPRPYDDTGWSSPYLRNVKTARIDDKAIFDQPMTLVTATEIKVPGTISGTGSAIVIDNTTDSSLVTFRFRHKDVKMWAVEEPFDLLGHHFVAGAIVIPNADRAVLEPSIRELGLVAWATSVAPAVMHEMTVPRIGYLHSWTSTQDEGWWRLALDHLKIPYDYFGDNQARGGNLRAKYDVIIYPQTTPQTDGEGQPAGPPTAYKKTDLTPNIGTSPDQTDDTRGGLGRDGVRELAKFVNEGGVLITEGGTARIFPQFQVTAGINLDQANGLYAPGSVLKTMLGDKTSPILYGYDQNSLGVLYNVGPLFSLGGNVPPANAVDAGTGGGAGGRGGGRGGALPPGVGGGSLQPMATAPQLTTLDGGAYVAPPVGPGAFGTSGGGRGGGFAGGAGPPGGGRGGRGGAGAVAAAGPAPTGKDMGITTTGAPRVLLSYPTDPSDLLLSGELVGGDNLAGRPVLIDQQIGKGHAVLFGCRPFWRYETSGSYPLVFNAILNWDHLDAGKK